MATPNSIDPVSLTADSCLTHDDIDRALRRMKSGLALVQLKRKLLASGVDARDALNFSEEILALQKAA
jgi:hypothetical protein